jgi:hypothetical protein
LRLRTCLLLASLLFAPSLGQANLISLQGGPIVGLAPNTGGQVLTLLLSGTDLYSSTDFQIQINGGVGPAPFITAIFGDTGSLISPSSLYAGSIWAGGSAGITVDPNGTWPSSSGLTTGGGFATPAFVPQTTNGIYATITVSTVGIPSGNFSLTLDGTIMTYVSPEFDEIPVPLQFAPMTIGCGVCPEPSTYVMATIGGVALLAVRRRKCRV